MFKTVLATSSLVLLSLTAAACAESSSDTPEPPKFDVVKSSLARETNPVLTPAELTTLEKGQAEFSVSMLKAVTAKKSDADNVFISPHSISTALGMAYAGAVGETAAEMKKALHLELADDRVHTGYNAIDLALSSRGKNQTAETKRANGTAVRPFQLKVANSFWGEKTLKFETPFLDTLATNYGAGVNIVDFSGAPDPSRLAINKWVEDNTEKRIKDLLPVGSIDGLTPAVLVNAVYFNASWSQEFDKKGTKDAPFTKLDGSTSNVSMMNGVSERSYKKSEGFEAVAMPYFGNELDMLTIVPDAGTFKTFESSLTGAKVLEIMAGLETKNVNLAFPKLKLETSSKLKEPLQAMGMNLAFGGTGNFTGITTQDKIWIGDVYHKTFLAVDEEGTEAAAATAVVFTRESASADPVVMKVDRPFLTAIVDRQTKTILFVGRIVDPK